MSIVIKLKRRPSQTRVATQWQYSVEPEYLYHPDLGEYHTYGIRVTAPDYTDILHDVSACEKTAARIVELSNLYQLFPGHLHDFVMDMLD